MNEYGKSLAYISSYGNPWLDESNESLLVERGKNIRALYRQIRGHDTEPDGAARLLYETRCKYFAYFAALPFSYGGWRI